MKDIRNHPWKVTAKEACGIQERLQATVVTHDELGHIRFVAGVDVGLQEKGAIIRAAVAVLNFPDLELCEYAIARRPVDFPYIPGLLSFREVPAVLDAMGRLNRLPDLLLCDGQGRAHPRRFGIACHLGVLSQIPSIGVAKSRLIGKHRSPADERGAWEELVDKNEVIGAVLRTRVGVKPLFISIGHMVSLETAIDYVLRCTPRYRLPETTRRAHGLASG